MSWKLHKTSHIMPLNWSEAKLRINLEACCDCSCEVSKTQSTKRQLSWLCSMLHVHPLCKRLRMVSTPHAKSEEIYPLWWFETGDWRGQFEIQVLLLDFREDNLEAKFSFLISERTIWIPNCPLWYQKGEFDQFGFQIVLSEIRKENLTSKLSSLKSNRKTCIPNCSLQFQIILFVRG